MYTNPNQPTYIDLKPVREKKSDEPLAGKALFETKFVQVEFGGYWK
jgi:hypothetical protein